MDYEPKSEAATDEEATESDIGIDDVTGMGLLGDPRGSNPDVATGTQTFELPISGAVVCANRRIRLEFGTFFDFPVEPALVKLSGKPSFL